MVQLHDDVMKGPVTGILMFLWCQSKQAVKQTVESSVIWVRVGLGLEIIRTMIRIKIKSKSKCTSKSHIKSKSTSKSTIKSKSVSQGNIRSHLKWVLVTDKETPVS